MNYQHCLALKVARGAGWKGLAQCTNGPQAKTLFCGVHCTDAKRKHGTVTEPRQMASGPLPKDIPHEFTLACPIKVNTPAALKMGHCQLLDISSLLNKVLAGKGKPGKGRSATTGDEKLDTHPKVLELMDKDQTAAPDESEVHEKEAEVDDQVDEYPKDVEDIDVVEVINETKMNEKMEDDHEKNEDIGFEEKVDDNTKDIEDVVIEKKVGDDTKDIEEVGIDSEVDWAVDLPQDLDAELLEIMDSQFEFEVMEEKVAQEATKHKEDQVDHLQLALVRKRKMPHEGEKDEEEHGQTYLKHRREVTGQWKKSVKDATISAIDSLIVAKTWEVLEHTSNELKVLLRVALKHAYKLHVLRNLIEQEHHKGKTLPLELPPQHGGIYASQMLAFLQIKQRHLEMEGNSMQYKLDCLASVKAMPSVDVVNPLWALTTMTTRLKSLGSRLRHAKTKGMPEEVEALTNDFNKVSDMLKKAKTYPSVEHLINQKGKPLADWINELQVERVEMENFVKAFDIGHQCIGHQCIGHACIGLAYIV